MSLLKVNFILSVWLTIGYGVVAAFGNIMAAGEIFALWGPFATRFFLAPFVLAGMQLLWWFTAYRPYGLEARPVMIFMGLAFLCLLLVMWLNAQMHEMTPGMSRYLGVAYVAAAHLGYGIFGREQRFSGR